MERKFLEGLGLEKDAIDKILDENSSDIGKAKGSLETKIKELEAANGTIKELREAVKKFDGKDPDKLSADLAELQKRYDADIAKTKLDAALDLAIVTGKAKNAKAVRALLKMDDIKLDGDKVTGLDDQLKKLRESDGYLFEDASQSASGSKAPTFASGGDHGTGLSKDPLDVFEASARSAAGLKMNAKE